MKQIRMEYKRKNGYFKRFAEKRGKFNDGVRTIKKAMKVYQNFIAF